MVIILRLKMRLMNTKELVKKAINNLNDDELKAVYQYIKQFSEQGKSSKNFSFEKAQEATKNFKGALSDSLIEERRSE